MVTFDLRNMFITGGDTEECSQVGNVPTHGFELVVGKHDGHFKSPSNIRSDDSFEVLEHVAILHVVQLTSRSELDMLGDSREERDACHFHNVDRQGNVLILLHNLNWNGGSFQSDLWRTRSHSLAF